MTDAATIQTTIQVVGLVIGVVVVMWQLSRQHGNAIAEQRDQAREQLRLEIHKDIAAKIIRADSALTVFGTTAWSTVGMLDVRRKSLNEGGRDIQSLTSTTSERFTRQYAAASGATLEVIWILESYEIAFPGFETFRTRLVEKSAELSTKFGNLHSALLGYLAMTLPGHERQGTMTIVPPPPDTAKLDELRTLSDSLREVEFDIHMYLSDLRVAAQNHLLAGIFPGYRAKERRPDDPRFEVLRPMLGPSRSGRSSRSTPV